MLYIGILMTGKRRGDACIADFPPTTSTEPASRRRRSRIILLLEAVLALAAVIVLAEVLLAAAGLGEQEIVRPDPIFGMAPFENKHITWRKEGFSRTSYNSQGMNDAEYPLAKPPGTKRIAFVGNSCTEALQVERKENFCALVQNELSTKDQPVECMNWGVSGYNLAQLCLKLERQVFAYHPDLVVLVGLRRELSALEPLPADSLTYARPYFRMDPHGNLVLDYSRQKEWSSSPDGIRMSALDWLRRNSRIWGIIGGAVGETYMWVNEQKENIARSLGFQNKQKPLDSYEMAVNNKTIGEAILKRMKSDCEQHNCRLEMIVLPPFDGNTADRERDLLMSAAKQAEIPAIDLSSYPVPPEIQLFYGWHFRPEGHKFVAPLMVQFIQKNGL